jgi:hypothetical protein
MNMFAGNVATPPPVSPWQVTAGGNEASAIGGVQGYAGLGQQFMPYAQNTFQSLYNNPYSGQALQGAQGAAGMGGMAANNQFALGQGAAGAGASLIPYASQVMQSGFDPQQALYNQQFQQNVDQTRAGEAARGIATSPYGAGLENQSNQNFNMNWENQQLARQAQAAGAAGGLVNQGVGAMGQGASMMSGAPNVAYQSAMLPYGTWSGIGQGQNQALSGLMGYGGMGQNMAQMPVQDWAQALSGANQMQQLQNQNAQLNLNQSQLGWNQLGQLGSGLGSMFGGQGMFGSGGAFGGAGAFGSMFGSAGAGAAGSGGASLGSLAFLA